VHRLAHPCVRWLIQIPRLYHIYRKMGEITSFNHMVNKSVMSCCCSPLYTAIAHHQYRHQRIINIAIVGSFVPFLTQTFCALVVASLPCRGRRVCSIFAPLFEVTRDPASNPQLHAFLGTVVGFDCVDDESIAPPEAFDQPHQQPPTPAEWTHTANPPYSYWMYYLYANLAALNQLRTERGMNTFEFRPHRQVDDDCRLSVGGSPPMEAPFDCTVLACVWVTTSVCVFRLSLCLCFVTLVMS